MTKRSGCHVEHALTSVVVLELSVGGFVRVC